MDTKHTQGIRQAEDALQKAVGTMNDAKQKMQSHLNSLNNKMQPMGGAKDAIRDAYHRERLAG